MLRGHRSYASLSAFPPLPQSIVLQSIGNPAWLVIAGYLCMVINAIPGYLVSWLACSGQCCHAGVQICNC